MLNIEHTGSKTKKRYKRNLISLFKKLIKSPKAKQAKGKKYYKKGQRVSTRTYNILALD